MREFKTNESKNFTKIQVSKWTSLLDHLQQNGGLKGYWITENAAQLEWLLTNLETLGYLHNFWAVQPIRQFPFLSSPFFSDILGERGGLVHQISFRPPETLEFNTSWVWRNFPQRWNVLIQRKLLQKVENLSQWQSVEMTFIVWS